MTLAPGRASCLPVSAVGCLFNAYSAQQGSGQNRLKLLLLLELTLLAASWLFSCLQPSTGKMKVPGKTNCFLPSLRLTWLAWHPVTGVRLPSAPFGSRGSSAIEKHQARSIDSTSQQEPLATMLRNGERACRSFCC